MKNALKRFSLSATITAAMLAIVQPAWADDCRKPKTKRFTDVQMGCLSEGLAIVHGKNGKYGFIDRNGKVAVPLQYGAGNMPDSEEYYEILPDDMVGFSEGLARVSLGSDHNWGFIDKTGREVIPPQYNWAYDFHEGLAAVRKDGKWQFIDKTGKAVMPPQYDWADSFSEGLAPVGKDGKTYFIDKNGKVVLSLPYDRAYPFYEGSARVNKGDKVGFIDKTGKLIGSWQDDTEYAY